MFANTQMMGLDTAFERAGRVRALLQQANAQRALPPEQARILHEVHATLEASLTAMRNMATVLETQQKAIAQLSRRR
jgi:hypothetical protein